MIPLFTQEEFEISKSQDLLPLSCKHCKKTFYRTKRILRISEYTNYSNPKDFCSISCKASHQNEGHLLSVVCDQCGNSFKKLLNQIKRTSHNFCSQSCAAQYHNSHKQTGTRRSKLEIWLEGQLVQLHPELKFHFNRTDAIEAELDIYIPSLKLAFELNGILHYEPIYGADKLDRIHKNDNRKLLACAEHGIELCILDTSKMIHFKEKGARKFLELIEGVLSINVFGSE